MRRSMTAYGRAVVQTRRARWTLEIASVNRKGLDIHLHLPQALLFLDPLLRKWVAQIAERGSLTIRLSCQMKEISSWVQQLQEEKKRWEEIACAIGVSQDQITLPFLLTQVKPQEVVLEEVPFEQEASLAWKKASKAWIQMKEQEGRVLTQDIHARLKTIEQELKAIEKEFPKVIKEHLAKLSRRMEELKLTASPQELQQGMKNGAILEANRADVTEEILRLRSHREQMTLYLKSAERSVGRTLDFLAQEMGREIGTIMAKAGSSAIAKRAVHIKNEVEKIREQVQNIE
jgi:uncharacterized protein (TIGR00255 family)